MCTNYLPHYKQLLSFYRFPFFLAYTVHICCSVRHLPFLLCLSHSQSQHYATADFLVVSQPPYISWVFF